MKRNVLITGSSGMLGKDIYKVFSANPNFNVYGIDLIFNKFIANNFQFIGDLTDFKFLEKVLNDVKPNIIIHCAAIVNIDLCQENKDLPNTLHVKVTNFFSKTNSKLIYISTDSIFDGKKGNYNERDIPNPINYYAKSKYDGEIEAKKNSDHIIIRTNIFGFNFPLKNSIVEWAINNFRDNKEIFGFSDIKFNPIYTYHLAEILFKLVEIDYKGIINVASKNNFSKYEFLKKLAILLEYSKYLVVRSDSKKFDFKIPRPINTVLNIDKLKKIVNVPSIEEGIDKLSKDFSKFIE